jgi:hypothetical protein
LCDELLGPKVLAEVKEFREGLLVKWVKVAVNDWFADLSAVPQGLLVEVDVIDSPDKVDSREVLRTSELIIIKLLNNL